MQNTIQIECPAELLLGLQMNAERFAETVKLHTAIALFREGRISSELAAKWLQMPRTAFLFKAMEYGAELPEDSADDFSKETALL